MDNKAPDVSNLLNELNLHNEVILARLDDIDYNIAAIKDSKIKITSLQQEILELRGQLKTLQAKSNLYEDAYNSQVHGFLKFLTWLIDFEHTTHLTETYSIENRWDLDPDFLQRLQGEVCAQWTRKQ